VPVLLAQLDPCASANPCAAADPCASANPCAAADPCASANPCAAADPCASANPCAAADPCASANPCASADPCASANPCAGADVVQASEPPHPEVYVESASNLAIRGADPVAYFTEGAAVPGNAAYSYSWNGATWHFSSAQNRALFAASPEAYAPQYGGYCAKAMSEGNLASVDPRVWEIVDGKLYLNYSAEVQQQWVEDIPGNIEKADSFWPGVLTVQTFYENVVSWAG
jgi:YHS domain-containing protein